ncbi:MAG: hypothetical protein C4293_19205 [Nitrospiraceae bacterium]
MRTTEPRRILCLAAIILVLAGCAPAKVRTSAAPGIEQYNVQTIVVMPFERLMTPQILDSPDPEFSVPRGARRSDISVMVPPPSPEKLDLQTVTVPPYAPEKVTQIMYRKLRKREGILVLPLDEATRAAQSLGGKKGEFPEQMAKEVAKKLGADAALVGRVLVYREREGSKWGARPAIVGFEVKLIGADGEILWTADYYEKQRPMIEDIAGFLERRGVFVTAEELAEYGAERIVRKFPFGNL